MDLDNDILQMRTSKIGARISFLRKGEKYFIFPQQTIKKEDKDIIRGGMHLCSPNFGKKNGEFAAIPQHGGLRDVVWRLKSPSNPHSIEYEYEFKLKEYGYRLVYNVCYRLLHNCLQVVASIENKLETPVPFEFGWHPYFATGAGATISFIDSKDKFIYIDQPYGPKIFADNKIIEIKLRGAKAINLLLGKGFAGKYVCIWTDSKEYVCVEPLLSHPDNFNTEKGLFLEQHKPLAVDFMMWFR